MQGAQRGGGRDHKDRQHRGRATVVSRLGIVLAVRAGIIEGCETQVLMYQHILFLPAVLAECKGGKNSGEDVLASVVAVSKVFKVAEEQMGGTSGAINS